MKTFSLATAAVAIALFGLAGCAKENPPVSQEDTDKMVKFSKCMKEHGVDIGDPLAQGGTGKTFNPQDPKMLAAEAACRSLAPAAHKQGNPPPGAEDRALKVAECLRKKGIDAKDPEPGGIEVGIDQKPGVSNEKLVEAYAACNKEHPAP